MTEHKSKKLGTCTLPSSIIRRILVGTVVLAGVVVLVAGLFCTALYFGLAYGVDPLNGGITTDGVQALIATQRMGDKRLYIYIDNSNKQVVSAEITVDVYENPTHKHWTQRLQTVLGPKQGKRIYPPDRQAYSILSLNVTRQPQNASPN